MSTKGHQSEFDFTLSDFKCQEISDDIMVNEVFQATGITRLRFYITTKHKGKPSTVVALNQLEEVRVGNENCSEIVNINSDTDSAIIISTSTSQECHADNGDSYQNINENPDYVTRDCYFNVTEGVQSDDDGIIATAIRRSRINLPPFLVSSDDDDNTKNDVYDEQPECLIDTVCSSIDLEDIHSDPQQNHLEFVYEHDEQQKSTNKFILILHRGHVLDEMIEQFLKFDITSSIEIEIYLPNGEKEAAKDVGGVFRDILSEFWRAFYEKYTMGTHAKVPVIRHDFDESKWLSVAKILLKGWLDEKYYPVQLSKTFMERCIFGKVFSDLTEDLLRYVSEMDSRLITSALDEFENVELDELLECLDTMECKWKPDKSNFRKLISDLAHKELIQKPMFVIDCWSTILSEMVTIEDLHQKYNNQENLPRNILRKIVLEEPLDDVQQTIANYLKKFIRECNANTLSNFLRFVTGADILIENVDIKVSFSSTQNKNMRTPTAHTCSCLLVLPTSYDSYPDFRHEFSSVLNANIWVMDIV